MITCPWCGSNYVEFQTNCPNCGGPLPLPEKAAPGTLFSPADQPLPRPPAPPRTISRRFAWKLLAISGIGITGMVFLILAVTFGLTGLFLMLFTAGILVLGLIFTLLGIIFLAVGGILLVIAYRRASQVVQVLRLGEATTGRIREIRQDLTVTVHNNHPYITTYEFEVFGQRYVGRVNSLQAPIPQYLPGAPATILYLPGKPQINVLYPHP